MKWVTYRHSGQPGQDRVGLVIGERVNTLPTGATLLGLLGDDGSNLAEAVAAVTSSPDVVRSVGEIDLRAPIPEPPSLRDFAAFEQHCRNGLQAMGREWNDGWYTDPVFYYSNPRSVVGPSEEVLVPGHSNQLDFELEVGIVIGRPGRDLAPGAAEDHIVGLCVLNDWSARDLQAEEAQRAPLGPSKGKDFATGLGPFLVTLDELADARKPDGRYDLAMTATVNGKQYSTGNLADIYWTFAELVSYASRGVELHPGDVLGTGTCGFGCIFELSAAHGERRYPWLVEGDDVVLDVEQLGALRSPIRWGLKPPQTR